MPFMILQGSWSGVLYHPPERYNRLMVDEVLYARPYTSEQARREALAVWVNHYNYHRPHTSCGNAPPASLPPQTILFNSILFFVSVS